jgi:hypothetical protein
MVFNLTYGLRPTSPRIEGPNLRERYRAVREARDERMAEAEENEQQ